MTDIDPTPFLGPRWVAVLRGLGVLAAALSLVSAGTYTYAETLLANDGDERQYRTGAGDAVNSVTARVASLEVTVKERGEVISVLVVDVRNIADALEKSTRSANEWRAEEFAGKVARVGSEKWKGVREKAIANLRAGLPMRDGIAVGER